METMRVGVMAAVVGYGRSAMAVSVPALAALVDSLFVEPMFRPFMPKDEL